MVNEKKSKGSQKAPSPSTLSAASINSLRGIFK